MGRFNRDRAVQVLVDAYVHGDDKVAAMLHGLDPRTVRNYRARLERDPELSKSFHAKKAKIDADRDERTLTVDRELEELRSKARLHNLQALVAGNQAAERMILSVDEASDLADLLKALQGGYKLFEDADAAHTVLGDLYEPTEGETEGNNVVPIRKTT